ncbi:MAG: PorV/PorQ family protein [Candidatus Cloacimonadota bacterium]|nr:PorV/PorQ family protein [Candidatus Cloacimonadota bacterium]
MKKLIFIMLMISLIPMVLNAEVFPKTGTKGLQFLKLGIDSRAVGMAGAYVAVTDDISSVFWNPAGLALSFKKQVMFSHTMYVAGISHEYFASSMPTMVGTFAISASLLHMDYMEIRTAESWDPTGEEFTAYDVAIAGTWARPFTEKFSFGMTAKYLQENLYEYSDNGFSVDLGSKYNTLWKNLTIGMSLRNFGSDFKFEVDNDNDGSVDEDPFDLLDNDNDGLIDEDREELAFGIPMSFSLGLSADIIDNENSKLIGSFQIDNFVDRKEVYSLGFEYNISNFYLRTGKYFAYDAHNFSAGLGFRIPVHFAIINVDWSYTDMGYLSESFVNSSHRLSLKMQF